MKRTTKGKPARKPTPDRPRYPTMATIIARALAARGQPIMREEER